MLMCGKHSDRWILLVITLGFATLGAGRINNSCALEPDSADYTIMS